MISSHISLTKIETFVGGVGGDRLFELAFQAVKFCTARTLMQKKNLPVMVGFAYTEPDSDTTAETCLKMTG